VWGVVGWRTFSYFVDGDGAEIYGLAVGTQRSAFVAEEVFADLGLACLLQVGVVAVSAAA
jgi:hypothetical protein